MNSKKKWEVIGKLKNESAKVKSDEIIEILLQNRGLKSVKEIDTFLHPKLTDITIENVHIDKKQLQKALARVQQAIAQKHKIIIYGDYDVDGITGTAILWESLHAIGADVSPYIPHRIDEGYGLSLKGIENILTQFPDTKLIITVDNGIVANDAVDFANSKDLEVIITDHHTIGEELPHAYAIVHTTQVCGAAVGFLFARELVQDKMPKDLLSLVALATVADLVPLTGANRTLLTFGLEFLKKTRRPGLLALFEEAKIEAGKIDVYTIGHVIAPRLNAMGRLESAMDSLRLLCTTNRSRAKELADMLGVTNKERQVLTSSTVEHAKLQVINQKSKVKSKILFIHHESYEEGVIGLVAGKLVETFYLPAIVLSKKEKYSKASARSIAGFNIIEAIRKASDLLVNAGGHPMAAGFTVETEKIELLKATLEQIADGVIDETMLQRILRIDVVIPLEAVGRSLFDSMQQLAPFGMANPEPVFTSKVMVREVRQIGMDGKHLKMSVAPVGAPMTFDAIAFGMGDAIAGLRRGSTIRIAYSINENTWNGRTSLQLVVKDIQYPLP